MIKIIIVDNNEEEIKKTKKIISKVNMIFDIDVMVECFNKYNSNLENEINKVECKKIYLLEINLNDSVSGIDIAKKIRENDWDSEIIFITNHDKMFETVFRSIPDVFDFIEKFHNFEEKLYFDIDRIFRINFDNKMFKFKTRNLNFRIYYNSILYIYRDTSNRKIVIVTKNNSYYLSMNLKEVMKNLDYRFKYTHRACIVNEDKVVKYDWLNGLFELDNKEKVHLLSKKFKSLLDRD